MLSVFVCGQEADDDVSESAIEGIEVRAPLPVRMARSAAPARQRSTR